tara:strand:+ start:150 stop:374 length:225 start_codon:yes stop_codon:yes gene_type:complete
MKKSKKRITIKLNEQKEEMSYASAKDRKAQQQQQQRQILIQRINQYMGDLDVKQLNDLIKFFHMGKPNWQAPEQ